MHSKSNNLRPISEIARDLRAFCGDNEISQMTLAEACGLNQSQVSRLLKGQAKGLTKGMRALCIYASISVSNDDSYDPASDVRLMGALRAAVQNSAARARQIERLMSVLAEA